MKHRHSRLAVPLMIALLGVGGCSGQQEAAASTPQPAQVQSIEGSDLHRVTLTEQAMDRVGIQTVAVRAATAPSKLTIIPVSAVIYDPQGRSWTYIVPDVRTFMRQAIVIDHIDGTNAFLKSGPSVGSQVVTVGSAELLGTEYGVGEE